MPASPVNRPLSAERTVFLAEFARASKSATRPVSLYSAIHPSIQFSLARMIASAGRLVPAEDATFTVFPSAFAIDGEAPERTDPAVGELAGLMHNRLIGTLHVERNADALGDDPNSVSREFEESNLGGVTLRLKVVVGR